MAAEDPKPLNPDESEENSKKTEDHGTDENQKTDSQLKGENTAQKDEAAPPSSGQEQTENRNDTDKTELQSAPLSKSGEGSDAGETATAGEIRGGKEAYGTDTEPGAESEHEPVPEIDAEPDGAVLHERKAREHKAPHKKRSIPVRILRRIYLLFLLFIVLIVSFIGFTQTQTFRDLARDQLLSILNGTVNGRIELEKIQGTIFTSLILDNAAIYDSAGNKIIGFKKLELYTSPTELLLKTIHIRNLIIDGLEARLETDSLGVLNIAKVFPPSEEPEDTVKSEFPFKIKISNLEIKKSYISMQDYKHHGSTDKYDELNFSDFRLKDFNLRLSANAWIAKDEYSVNIDGFSFDPNFNFSRNFFLAAEVYIRGDDINLNSLQLATKNTSLDAALKVSGINFFKDTVITDKKLSDLAVNLTLAIDPLNFDDLATFVPGLSFLKGDVRGNISVEGTLGKLEIPELRLSYGSTDLRAEAFLRDMFGPDGLYIYSKITNSRLFPTDITNIMPSLEFPDYGYLGEIIIDSLSYYGKPDNFNTGAHLHVKEGELINQGRLDFSGKEMKYETVLQAVNLDVSAFTSYPLVLNTTADIAGEGTDLKTMLMDIMLDGTGSVAAKSYFEKFDMTAKAENGILTFDADFKAGPQDGKIKSEINFNGEKPGYYLSAVFDSLNLAALLPDTAATKTILNITMEASGDGFDPENMNALLTSEIKNSSINDQRFGKVNATLQVEASEGSKKRIELASNIADIKFNGDFTYSNLGEVISRQLDSLGQSISKKIDLYFPSFEDEDTLMSPVLLTVRPPKPKPAAAPVPVLSDSVDVKFEMKFNDLSLFSIFMNNRIFVIDGVIKGRLISDSLQFYTGLTTDLKSVEYSDGKDFTLVSNSKSGLEVFHKPGNYALEDISVNLSSDTKRIYTISGDNVTTIKDIQMLGSIQKSKFDLERISLNVNDFLKAKLAAASDFNKDSLFFDIYEAVVKYNDFEVTNDENILVTVSRDMFRLINFNLGRGSAYISANAAIKEDSIALFDAELKGLKIADVVEKMLKIQLTDKFDGLLDFNMTATGTLSDPEFRMNFSGDNLSYNGSNLGLIDCKLNYADKTLYPDFKYFNNKKNLTDSLLFIRGEIPFELSVYPFTDSIPDDRLVDVDIVAESFSIASLGVLIPYTREVSGRVESEVNVSGYYPNITQEGSLRLSDASFLVTPTKLKYGGNVELSLKDSTLTIDKLLLENLGEVKHKGKINGSGTVNFSGLELSKMNLALAGDLTVIESTKPNNILPFSGILYMATENPIEYNFNKGYSTLTANIIVKEGSLVFPPLKNTYKGVNSNYIYRDIEVKLPGTGPDRDKEKIDAILDKNRSKFDSKKAVSMNFDYRVKVKLENEAAIVFFFSEEANQKLNAKMQGELIYEQEKGFQNVQGELKLLDNSTLEFLKTFQAEGIIRFESDIADPYLDVTARYKSYYIFTQNNNDQEKEVQVKVKLKGALSNLATSFTKAEDNIAVYVGQDDISNDVASVQYDKADAVWFILTGKFKSDLTQEDKSSAAGQVNAITGTATSLAGSLLGGLLSSYLGDFVQSIEFRNSGTDTKFNLSGRISDIKYTFGGNTNFLSDLSSANFRFEIPVISNLLFRVERKESGSETSTKGQMINELGLKFRFEF